MKKLLTFLTLLTLSIGVGWAAEATFTLTNITSAESVEWSGATVDDITVSASIGTGTNVPTYYSNGNAVRFYKNNTLTITGATITKIVFTSSNSTLGNFSTTTGSYSSGTWTGSASSITFGVSAAARLTKIVVTYTSGGTPTCVDPTFSPAAGTYYEPQNVTLSSTTTGATIRYTTNGTEPTATTGTVYSSPISVTSTTTIKAIATATGYNPSSVASATYTINTPATHTPTYEEDFSDGFGDFYRKTVTDPGFDVWTTGSYSGTTYAKAAAYKNNANHASESWLISPYIYLANTTNPELSFSQAIDSHFGTIANEATLWVKEKNASTWTQINIDYPDAPTTGYTDFESQTISLSDYKNKTIQLAFVYKSTTSHAGNWEVTDFKVEDVDTSAPEYYLVGTFNEWHQSTDYKFTKSGDSYVLNGVDLPDNAEFQINKVVDGETTWIGGYADGDVYGIHGGHHENIGLGGSKNFKIEAGAITNFSFTVDNNENPSVLNVSRDAQFFVKGDFNGWNREAMTATATGWTIEHVISSANQFGFVDEWGYWYGGRDWWIQEEHLGNALEIKPDGNFYLDIAGTDDYTLTVNSDKTTLTVSKIEVPTGDIFTLVESAEDLVAGNNYILVSRSGSATYSGVTYNYDPYVLVPTSGQTVQPGENGVVLSTDYKTATVTTESNVELTLGGIAGAWTFNNSTGYLYLSSNANNLLFGTPNTSSNAETTITISEAAKIVFNDNPHGSGNQSDNPRFIQFNPNAQATGLNPRFACYAGTNKPVYLYKKVEAVERATPPVITPASQNVKGGLLEGVMITAAEGATIHYTLDGSEPTVDSDDFDGQAFSVTGTGGERKMVRAIAVENGKAPSYPASVTYTFQAPATPTISPAGGTYEEPVEVSITSTDGGIIYYLVDPTEAPTNAADVIAGNQVYTEGETEIILSENGTHKVYAAVDLNGITSWAQATYTINIPVTLNPPVFLDYDGNLLDGGESISEDYPIYIGSEYGPGATLYYLLDPETVPSDANEVKEIGISCGEYSEYVHATIAEVFLGDPGQHTIYAVVEIEGYLSSVASITLNVFTEGEWKLVDWDYHYKSNVYDYIIVSADRSKVIGAYENGHFTALDCENNVIFSPDYRTATVNNDDIKIFNIESTPREGQNGLYDRYLMDTDGTYYNFGEGDIVSEGKSPIEVNYDYGDGSMILRAPYPYLNVGCLQYSDGVFSMFNMSSADATRVIMYYRPRLMTLAELCKESEYNYMYGGDEFTIKDELIAVECTQIDGHVLLWCKDNNASVEKTFNPDPENIEDYMRANHFFNQEWDQSNWILVAFENANYNEIRNYIGYHIAPGTLKGEVTIARQKHTLYTTATELELAGDVVTEFTPNLYCPANFLKENHNGNATGTFTNAQGVEITRHYFFMNPKIEEICDITFAVWYDADWGWGYFTLPAASATANITNIQGAFSVVWDYNIYGDQTDNLVVGQVYKLHAFVREPEMITKDGETVEPQTDVNPGPYNVYPLDFKPEENIITSIDTVNMFGGNGEVKSVKYVNVAGMVSDTPFQGVNIVVTEYTDGTRTTTKMLKK